MEWRSCIRNAAPFAAMMAVECTDIGISTLSKAAMTKGMSNFVFVVYANALGSLLLLPFVLSRRKRAPLTISVLCKFFILSLIGSLAQMLESTGVKYSSPTLSSAMGNLIPIFTYVLAIFFRMEELDLRSSSGVAKFLGAWVSVLGAFTVTLYKGQKILSAFPLSGIPHQFLDSQQPNWVLAGLLLSMAFLLFALMGIFQTAVARELPENTTIVFFFCFFNTILCGSFFLIVERNPQAWKLNPDIELISVVYSAILGCVVHNSVCTWCLKEKGPVFVAMFKPVGIAIAVAMASLFLGEPLYLGSVIGAVIIALGFYAVMWGKVKEPKLVPADSGICSFESSSERTPFLQNKPKEEI
ncbi:WAT1-related protein At4g15540-like [Rhododendron vialii]|uniref:WAT1-related protein At4g15540-like n=1 Tax=Rhododendron vialii TaxID=182163 RepID=UPI00265FEC36|nr:WAT1-related protein At4g15540-like [Rhododendron vialii]